MAGTLDIVQKLWNLCNVLRDDGITYHQYVTELTYLLFLKMMKETEREDKALPKDYRWDFLTALDGKELADYYRKLLVFLGTDAEDPTVNAIYLNAQTAVREPKNLKTLISRLDELDWYSAREEGLGNLYEGLLEKNAEEKKSGAGQYFTPRPLVNVMVKLIDPQPGERICDPAAGTLGFPIAADAHIKNNTADLYELTPEQADFQRKSAFLAVELVADTHRLAMMNAMLHGIEGEILLGDSLSGEMAAHLKNCDVILTNPPFGTKKGGELPSRDDLTYKTSNKQLNFLQAIYRALVSGGRAAVVLPDNVLFQEGDGREIRRDLMDKCNLHTVLRLPTGIFYAQGVKTNVLFFRRGATDRNHTSEVWFYDLRSEVPAFGKRTPLTEAFFDTFVRFYEAPDRNAIDDRRAARFDRAQIAALNDNLDLGLLTPETETYTEADAPDQLLQTAVEDLRELEKELLDLLILVQ